MFRLRSILFIVILWSLIFLCLSGIYIQPLLSQRGIDGTSHKSSMCSEDASRLGGLNQKVVSFSLYRPKTTSKDTGNNRFNEGVSENYEAIQKYYPGWLMRIYTDLPIEVVDLWKYKHNKERLFICNVTKLPRLGNLSGVHGMAWRFLPIGDPVVSIFIVRDLDSVVGPRERSAVKEWENSTKIFHAMRDNQLHNTTVLGGLWGANNYLMNQTTRQHLMHKFINESQENRIHFIKGYDQTVLRRVLYEQFRNQFMIHDSYFCHLYKDSIPFPEKRSKDGKFCGQRQRPSDDNAEACPVECRPSYGKDWEYC